VGEKWLSATRKVFIDVGGHLDLRYVTDWMAFALADQWSSGGWSIRVEQNQILLAEATNRAKKENLIATQFVRLDMEKEDYGLILKKRISDLIMEILRMGNEVARRTTVTLVPGEILPFAARRPDLLIELGSTKRFALPEYSVKSMLNQINLSPLLLRVKEEILEFESPSEMLDGCF